MDQATHNKIVSFIWGIADDVLRDLFKRGKYPDVILPMFVLRRMDAVLEPTKKAVLETREMLDKAGKHLARAFVGLVDDLGTNLRLAGFCSNRTHRQMRDYFQPQRRPYPHLLLTPLDPISENRFVGVLSAELKKMTAA